MGRKTGKEIAKTNRAGEPRQGNSNGPTAGDGQGGVGGSEGSGKPFHFEFKSEGPGGALVGVVVGFVMMVSIIVFTFFLLSLGFLAMLFGKNKSAESMFNTDRNKFSNMPPHEDSDVIDVESEVVSPPEKADERHL